MDKSLRNIKWVESKITRQDRYLLNKHKSCVLWFTGLSGSGKSTLAFELERRLFMNKIHSNVLDGDNIRHGLNKDLGFSPEDRNENIRRIAEVSKLFSQAGMFVLTAFISPFQEDREKARTIIGKEFVEIFVKCSLQECERRDVKGLYKKAREGEIKQFTGISSPYENPLNPEITIETDKVTIEEAVESILQYLVTNKYIRKSNLR